MTRNILAALAATLLVAAGVTAASLAGNGHTPPGGNNTCPPSYHEIHDQNGTVVGCEHNGDGGGNCGQNQSDNGGDHGYGHENNCTTDTTPTDTTPTDTTPTDTTPTDTTPTTPTDTTPTTPGHECVFVGADKDGGIPANGNTNDDCASAATTPTATPPTATTPPITAPVAPQAPSVTVTQKPSSPQRKPVAHKTKKVVKLKTVKHHPVKKKPHLTGNPKTDKCKNTGNGTMNCQGVTVIQGNG